MDSHKSRGHSDSEEDPDVCEVEAGIVSTATREPMEEQIELSYRVTDNPSLITSIFLGMQHFLTMFSSQVTFTAIIADKICMPSDDVARSQLLSTMLFVSGINTLLQSTLGSRLPIIQGSSGAFMAAIISILSMPHWKCPTDVTVYENNMFMNDSLNEKHQYLSWENRIRNIQGAVLVGGLFELIIGISGVLGLVMRCTGPLVICVVISLIGITLFPTGAELSGSCWPFAILVVALIILFSQYLGHIHIPILAYKRGKGFYKSYFPVLVMLCVLLSMVIVWLLCAILTSAGAFSSRKDGFGYFARTDTKLSVIQEAAWVRMPYPGQWGVPTFSISAIFGVIAANIASTIESVRDYHALARLIQEPPPPTHVINRGIGAEGFGCFLCGIFGVGPGTTSYSINIGVVVVSKVASRRVVQFAGLWMMILGLFSKFGAVFTTLPEPIVGGMFMFLIGYVISAGLANLQYVNLNTSRTMFILGFSFCVGIGIPSWINSHPTAIQTGSSTVDQMFTAILQSNMLLGGLTAMFFDNTLPGSSLKEKNNRETEDFDDHPSDRLKVYDLPLIMNFIRRYPIFKYIPISPTYKY